MTIEIKGKQEMFQTIRGNYVKRNQCMKNPENGTYYEYGVDCFQVDVGNGKIKWNRIDNGKIAYNCVTEQWELISKLSISGLLRGFYAVDMPQGYFKNTENIVYLKEYFSGGTPIPCLNSEIAIKLGYLSSLWDEYYYNPHNLSTEEKRALKQPKIVKYSRALEFNYNANEGNSAFRLIQEKYSKIEHKIEPRTWDISKLLFGKSFGIEWESRGGSLLEKDLGRLGLVPLKDGSLRLDNGLEPYEYATVPLAGAKGLETIKHICEELNKRCEFDNSCSLHIHLGNVKYDEISIMAYYILIQGIQEELYSIFPMYKRSESKYLGKPKDYNSPLPNIGLLTNNLFKKKYSTKDEFNDDVQKYFSKIISFLTSDNYSEWKGWNTNQVSHPLGSTKWNIQSRYHGFQFNSLVFSNTRTIEARLHPGSFNFCKITNWLFICVAIVTYAEKYSKEIISRKLKPTLADILEGYKTSFGYYNFEDSLGTEVCEYLSAYIEHRKEAIREANERGDVCARNIEFEADKGFVFSNGVLDKLY